jgi:hypothetical protein
MSYIKLPKRTLVSVKSRKTIISPQPYLIYKQTMSKILYKLPLALTLLSASVLYSGPTFAELGGAVSKEAVLIQTQSPVVATEQHLNVYLIKAPSGTQIKEYTNADNVVVAVTWQGPSLPNLKELLGVHFDTFVNRPTPIATNHRSAELRTDDLVVQSHGQMRNFAGRAYLPKLLPAGLNLDQIN